MIRCPFCHSDEVIVLSHDPKTQDAVIHCLNCDELVALGEEQHEGDIEDDPTI